MARADHSSHTSERGARCCPQDARQQAAAAAAPSAAVASHCGGTQVEGVVVLTGGAGRLGPQAVAGQQCLLAFPLPTLPISPSIAPPCCSSKRVQSHWTRKTRFRPSQDLPP